MLTHTVWVHGRTRAVREWGVFAPALLEALRWDVRIDELFRSWLAPFTDPSIEFEAVQIFFALKASGRQSAAVRSSRRKRLPVPPETTTALSELETHIGELRRLCEDDIGVHADWIAEELVRWWIAERCSPDGCAFRYDTNHSDFDAGLYGVMVGVLSPRSYMRSIGRPAHPSPETFLFRPVPGETRSEARRRFRAAAASYVKSALGPANYPAPATHAASEGLPAKDVTALQRNARWLYENQLAPAGQRASKSRLARIYSGDARKGADDRRLVTLGIDRARALTEGVAPLRGPIVSRIQWWEGGNMIGI